MNLKDLELKRSYDSDADDILNDFYIPALAVATFYNRLAGFFSSSSLAIAARGILGLIENNGTMKIIASPKLNENDLQVMMDGGGNDEKFIEEKLLSELTEIRDDFTRDHVFALGWMLANNKLEIKVAISYDHEGRPISINDAQQSGIFHQKVGILSDIDGNTITFSGSVNETAMGWLGNVEEFKVFRSWELIEEEYLKTDLIKFNNYWSDDCQRLRVIPVPDAVRKRLIEIAPTNIKDINLSRS